MTKRSKIKNVLGSFSFRYKNIPKIHPKAFQNPRKTYLAKETEILESVPSDKPQEQLQPAHW